MQSYLSPFTSSVRDTPLRLRLVVGLLWAMEFWVIQQATLGYDYPAPLVKEAISMSWRFVLDVLGATALATLLPAPLLIAAFFVWAFGALALLVYHELFQRALGWSTLSRQYREGLEGAGFATDYLSNPIFITLLVLLLAKSALLLRARAIKRNGDRRVASGGTKDERGISSSAVGLALLASYTAFAVVGVELVDGLGKLRRYASVDRMATTHGYVLTWLGEALLMDQDQLLAEAIERSKIVDDGLDGLLDAIEPGDVEDIVILQIESLDWRTLGHELDGRPITPFLRRQLPKSLVAKVLAEHRNGSADTDFIWLTGTLPSSRTVTYKIFDYPYADTLADKAREAGFTSIFSHGNSGRFFGRRTALEKMNFDEIWFLEELVDRGLQTSLWGIDDDDLLEVIADRVVGEDRVLAYVVTLTSHLPFNFVPPAKTTLESDTSSLEGRYFGSIHFTDRSLAEFYERLPEGTLLIMFGDHRSPANFEPIDPAFAADGEIVPVMIQLKGSRIRTETEYPAIPVEGTMLGAATLLHDWLDEPGDTR